MTQRVLVKTARGKKYVAIVESYYETFTEGNTSRKVRRMRTVKSLGPLSKLLEKDPDVLEHLRAQYESPEVSKHLKIAKVIEQMAAEGVFTEPPKEKDKKKRNAILNYGIWALKPIWDDWLRLSYRIPYLQKTDTKIQFDVNKVLSYLTYIKIADPSSYLDAYKRQSLFLTGPLDGIKLENLYQALGFIAAQKDNVMEYIHKRMVEDHGRKMEMVFYDCTNCYFESPYDDSEKLSMKIMKQMRQRLLDDGMTTEEFEIYRTEKEFLTEFAEEMAAATLKTEFLRMHGPSKERRYDLPIVSVALVIDTMGIPVDFHVFAGNESETAKMPEIINAMKAKYDIRDTVLVADSALNSITNLDMLKKEKMGYIVGQRLSDITGNYKKEMLDLNSYKIMPATPENYELWEFDDEGEPKGIPYKIINFKKTGPGYDPKAPRNKGKNTTLDCKLIFTYSKKRREKDLAELDKEIKRARLAVTRNENLAPRSSIGWRSLVDVQPVDDEKNKENDGQQPQEESQEGVPANKGNSKKKKKKYKAAGLKQDVIDDRRQIAGFAAKVYDKPEDVAEDLSDADILKSYHRLVRIEDCFRIMKNNLSIRPLHVYTPEHIRGHITICVLALIMLRLLQNRLAQNHVAMSVNDIQNAIAAANVLAVSHDGRDGLFLSGTAFSEIYSLENMKNSRNGGDDEDDDRDDLDKFIANSDGKDDLIDSILPIVGLTPLYDESEPSEIARSLKLRGGYQNLAGEAIWRKQARGRR